MSMSANENEMASTLGELTAWVGLKSSRHPHPFWFNERYEIAALSSGGQEHSGRNVLAFAAAAEATTGLLLLLLPSVVIRLLFGAEIIGAATAVSRVAGVSLVALGVACWPGVRSRRLLSMLIYSSLVALYFIYLGLAAESVGKLLWPAAVVHMMLTMFLAREWVKERRMPTPKALH